MRKSYIGEFDLWKLIAAVVIVILHSSYLPVEAERTYFHGGSIMVELFFLISGFFLAKSALRGSEFPKNGGRGGETWKFFAEKIRGIYPYLLFAMVVGVVAKTAFYHQDFLQLIKNGVRALTELFFLKSAGWATGAFVPQAWYLSAMMLSILILYPCIRKWGRSFVQLVCPVAAALILGYLFHKFGHFRNPDAWCTFFNKGFLRGFAEISLGCFCFTVAERVQEIRLTRLARVLCSIVEYGSLAAIIIYSNTESCWDMDCESVLLMAIAVIIMGSRASILSEVWDKTSVLPWLGKFSMMLYLNHMYWVWIFAVIGLRMEYPAMLALYYVCSCLSALVCWWVVDYIKTIARRCKALLIEEQEEHVA